jgi:predicted dehydrogenase
LTNKRLRWGIVGCANIAVGAVIPAIQQSETGIVAAIASRSLEKARATADKLNIPVAYGSYEELLADPSIDAVYIPLPNHLHKEWTIRAAKAGKHVLCEKPIALTAREAEEMVAACEEAGVLLAEAFMYRHHPRYDRLLEVIRSGEIGQIRGLHGSFTFNNAADKNNVRYRADWGGGSIYDVGCYPISAGRLIMGTEPVSACVTAFFSPEHDFVDMMAQGVIEFPGDVAMTFDCGMWADFRNRLEILGTDGRIEIPWAFLNPADGEGFYVVHNGEKREEGHFKTNQYTLQVDDFARSVFGEQPLRFAPQDAVLNMKVIDACLKSAREKTKVQIG